LTAWCYALMVRWRTGPARQRRRMMQRRLAISLAPGCSTPLAGAVFSPEAVMAGSAGDR
jgi:hypothetical protein